MFHFGFSYIGLIWLLMLTIPNLIWTKNKPVGYEESEKNENKILLIFERIGQVIVTISALIFSDFNIDLNSRSVSSLIVLGISFLLMICYELYWIRYFKSEKTLQEFYSSFLGIPVAGATYPVFAFFVLGLYGSNALMLLAVTILGIGHIGIHLGHKNEVVTKEKTRLIVRIIKWIGIVIGSLLVIVSIAYFGIKNITFAKAFVGAKNPVYEDKYVDLNGQKQFIRVMGKDIDNPVVILLHGGPAGPDGMMDYAFMDNLLDDYTYITWDQRGCGRTFYRNKNKDPKNETATDEQILSDIDALVDYVCNRFGKEKVIVLGHSWGTLLTVRYSQMHPEKIEKAICIGQVTDFNKGEAEAYEHARNSAVMAGDDTNPMDKAFEAFTNKPDLFTMMDLRTLMEPYNQPDVADTTSLKGALSPYLGIDDMRWLFIDAASVEKLYEHETALIDYIFTPEQFTDIWQFGTNFDIPIYFICGEMDYICSRNLAEKYYEDVTAPDKAFYEIKGCGHTPQADKSKEVADIIASLGLKEETPEKEEEVEVQVQKEQEYIADKSNDSYYSIIEDSCPLDVKTQQSGTCWTCAITSSMEGNYFKKYHEKISFDPTDLCLKIYDDNKSEGWFVHRDKLEFGGWDWIACDYLPNGYEGYYLKDAWRYEGNSIDELKDGIKNHGPIAVAVCDNTLYKNTYDGYFTMNDDDPDHLDHAVIIIGWDDNFPKDYFSSPAKNNGAWICQNSKSKGWGNDGIYYISYESLIEENVIFSVTNEYSDVVFYDAGNEKQISTGDVCTVANVFNKKGTLAGIGTYTNQDYQKYKIEIFEDNFGKLLCSFDGVSDIKGYHVTDLPEPIEVEQYTVAISFEGSASVEGESYTIDDMVEYVVTSSENQSFVWIDDKWVDMASVDIKERLGIDFLPNNACIKALYVK